MLRTLLILSFCSLMTLQAYGFPKYTGRENAIRLSKILDKGHFKNYHIAAIFVKNRSEKEYYLQAILEDGSKHDWYLDEIYRWSLTDQITLTDNRVMVFPSNESTQFFVLDKNEFHRLVLTSKAFVKSYEEHDLLAGKSLTLLIRKFQLINLAEEGRFKTDKLGNRYRYILDLQNGTREVLTYLDAHRLMEQGAFIQEPSVTDILLKRAFEITSVKTIPKKLEDELRNIWSFGIEVTFKRPIPINSDLFPMQVVEENVRHPKTGERESRFYVRIMFPNSQLTTELPKIRTFEYLQHIQLITDLEHQARTFLQAQISPDVFELPPHVRVTDRRSVTIHFFSITDQSVAKRSEFAGPITSEMASAPKKEKSNTAYDEYYLKAVEHIRSVQGHHDLHVKVRNYFMAIDALHEASLVATKDDQIMQAFAQRDVLLEVIPAIVVENTQQQLRQRIEGATLRELSEHLERAEVITTNREVLKTIKILQSRL